MRPLICSLKLNGFFYNPNVQDKVNGVFYDDAEGESYIEFIEQAEFCYVILYYKNGELIKVQSFDDPGNWWIHLEDQVNKEIEKLYE